MRVGLSWVGLGLGSIGAWSRRRAAGVKVERPQVERPQRSEDERP